MKKEEVYKENTEYSLKYIIGQNLFFVIYFGIGIFFSHVIVSLMYLALIIVMLGIVLRKHLCTNCYYYGKKCSTGWGKLSSWMFKKKSGNYSLGVKLAGITWPLLTLLPIVGITMVIILNYSLSNLLALMLFIFMTPFNFIIHRKACEKCKMRFICPASMIKSK